MCIMPPQVPLPHLAQYHVEYNKRAPLSWGGTKAASHTCRHKTLASGLDLDHRCLWPSTKKEKSFENKHLKHIKRSKVMLHQLLKHSESFLNASDCNDNEKYI